MLNPAFEDSTTDGGSEFGDGDGDGDGNGDGDGDGDGVSDHSSSGPCDPWKQDCPAGEKCVPYVYDQNGGGWDANKCVPILGGLGPGKACQYTGTFESHDDCDGSSFCWEVSGEGGTCRAFCEGNADLPGCAEGKACLVANEEVINLCVDACHPLTQNCNANLGCYWSGSVFVCVVVGGDGSEDQPCSFINDCTPGLACLDSQLLPGCAGTACCTPWCDVGLQGPCAQGKACIPWFDAGLAPPGYENVGICAVP
jgi:hypothetical protein